MSKTNYIWLLLISVIVFTACESDDNSLADPDFKDPAAVEYTSGEADFSTFVAVGNSLTAGFSDNALFAKGQNVSFPNILANQFATVGGGTFTQPLMNDDVGGLLLGGNPILHPVTGDNIFPPRLIFDTVNQVPTGFPGASTTDLINPIPGPYNNMGVPGAKVGDLLTVGYANPYFLRMASQVGTTVLQDALAMNPTFFSLWIGNNDVLGYATTGGDGTNPLTDEATFTGAYNQIVAALVSASPQGIIANIPSVTSAPFFTTVPYNPLDPSNPALAPQIAALNAQLYGPLDNIFTLFGEPDRVNPLSTTAANPVLINDENAADRSAAITGALTPVLGAPTATLFGALFGKARQSTADDLIVLLASSAIATPVTGVPAPVNINGVSYPMEDKWVLTPEEQAEIATATDAFNLVIANAASANNLPLFDANAFLNVVSTTGVTSGSISITDDFVTGGAFSLDGVHPSPRGYAVAANEMIDLINAHYSANIPKVNPANYTGVYID